MGAVLGDLIRCVDTQRYLNETILNVYYYRINAVAGLFDPYLDDLDASWEDQVLTPILALQSDTLQHTQREWRNLSNGVDLFVNSTIITGTYTASSTAPSFTSYGFMLLRESLVTRNGYKRFAGIPDPLIDGNSYVGTPSWLTDVENGLAADLYIALAGVAEPVIVKRPIANPAGVYQYSGIGSAQFRGIGTQNTRKQGRGI